jgi:molybdate transport system regulatory protein
MAERDGAPRLWIKIYFGDRGQLGPGKVQLLQGIAEHRSIAAAARALGMSYRRAWLLVDQLNSLFGQPVVATRTGGTSRGGAELTPLGQDIVGRYLELVELAQVEGEGKLGELARLIRPAD